jgi:hypothetical protein
MSKLQLQRLSHHFINSSPLGVIILNSELEIVFVNDVTKAIFHKETVDTASFFGELFQCKYIADTQYRCGSRRQCDNCKIRNSLLNASYFDRVIDHLKVKHAFFINGIETIKWFDITVIPTVVNRSSHLVLMLKDQTDMMNNLIEIELSEMLGQSFPHNVTFFSQQISQNIKRNSNKNKCSYLMKIACHNELERSVDEPERTNLLKKTFRTYLIQQLDDDIPILEEKLDVFYIFFVRRELKEIKALIRKLDQFCELNFEHFCKMKHQILQIDISDPMIRTGRSSQIVNSEVKAWLDFIDTIPEGSVTPYPLDAEKT